MKKFKILAVFALALGLTGCFTHTIKVGSGGDTSGAAASETTNSFFVAGLFGEANVDVSSACPDGNATVVVTHTIINRILQGVTMSLWAPATTTIYCGGGSAEVELSAEDMKKVAEAPSMQPIIEEAQAEQAAE